MVDFIGPVVARATPPGLSGISIVRLSGTGAIDIADQLFVPDSYAVLVDVPSRYFVNGKIIDNGCLIDNCLVVVFRAPHSFTGEDVVEFHLHGNPLITELVIDRTVAAGARAALPGEFTRRAFINGKLDLSQVEALGEVLHAESERALHLSQHQLAGDLRKQLERFRDALVDALARLELELDFVEEGYAFMSGAEIQDILNELRLFVQILLRGCIIARRSSQAVRIMLIGKPNAGKSSLFNAILGFPRSITSPLEGTTRDYIEEEFCFRGITFRLIDTAGLRFSIDPVESSGISSVYSLLPTADYAIYLVDGSSDESRTSEFDSVTYFASQFPSVHVIPVVTKADIGGSSMNAGYRTCSIFDLASIQALVNCIADECNTVLSGAIAVLSDRQYSLVFSLNELFVQLGEIDSSRSELLSAFLRSVLRLVGELLGESVEASVLESVFSRFCIGK